MEAFQKLRKIGFEVIKGSKLEKADNKLGVVDFGEFGMHLPDADLVVYEPKKCKPIAIISSKATIGMLSLKLALLLLI
ncbi:MAG: hypothetical protein ABIL89_01775 [candidate division WOR-3 bacterium]